MSHGKVEGVVFGTQRFSIHDGPGIRTTVFLKGCNMNCQWCHNPEGIPRRPVLAFAEKKCIGCGRCAVVCPQGAHSIDAGRHSYDRDMCKQCGLCAEQCPVLALTLYGKKTTADEVLQTVLRDRRYYKNGGGGVTLSGGEASLQEEFAVAVLTLCHEEGIHTTLETNGTAPMEVYEKLMPVTDLFLVDYKLTDPAAHKEFTGIPNDAIINNIKKLHDTGAHVLIRCLVIEGVNDNQEHFKAIAQLTQTLPSLVGAEILYYHNLGTSKAKDMKMDAVEFHTPEDAVVAEWEDCVVGYGGRLVHASES